eukprot:930061-Prymnesium_polylepis.1
MELVKLPLTPVTDHTDDIPPDGDQGATARSPLGEPAGLAGVVKRSQWLRIKVTGGAIALGGPMFYLVTANLALRFAGVETGVRTFEALSFLPVSSFLIAFAVLPTDTRLVR